MLFSEKICHELNIKNIKLYAILKNAPRKYRVYTIPKRTIGFRTIAHPSRELKKIQRICSLVFDEILPIHPCAYAYRKGLDIKKNALQHRHNPYFLKMDFNNYFNSITPRLFWSKIEGAKVAIDKKERTLLEKILFWQPSRFDPDKLKLSVGAPSSPVISNFVAYDFDVAMHEWCEPRGICYTRYADDLTFSTTEKNILFSVPRMAKIFLKKNLEGVTVNEMKTKFSSKKHNRHVTGITITSDDDISIGRNRKRLVAHLIHQYSLEALDSEQIESLKGYICFCEYIQPGFIKRMENKYSSELIFSLLKET